MSAMKNYLDEIIEILIMSICMEIIFHLDLNCEREYEFRIFSMWSASLRSTVAKVFPVSVSRWSPSKVRFLKNYYRQFMIWYLCPTHFDESWLGCLSSWGNQYENVSSKCHHSEIILIGYENDFEKIIM